MKARNPGRQGGAKGQAPASPAPRNEDRSPGGRHAALFAAAGVCLLLAALVCGLLVRSGSSAGAALAGLGMTAGPLAALGLALLSAAALLGLQNRASARLQALEAALAGIAADNTVIRTNLADLGSIDVAAKLAQVAGGLAPTEIKEALDKADEKLNNLTRAIRMFSQPLQDVSQAGEDLKADMARLQEGFKDLGTSIETLLLRLEDLSASLPARAGRELDERLSESLPGRLSEALAPVQERLAALPAAFQEGLAAHVHPLQEALRELAAPEEEPSGEAPLAAELKGLSGRLEELFSSLGERLEQAPAPDFKSLEARLASQIDRALERLRTFAPQSAPAPAPAMAMAAAPAAAPAHAAPPAPAKGNESVLSAIQKLKQMRGGS